MQPQQKIESKPTAKPLSNGDARGDAPSFEDIKLQYAQARLQHRFLRDGDPRKYELSAFMKAIETEAALHLPPEALAQAERDVEQLELQLYERQRVTAGERNKQAAMAEAVRRRNTVSRMATQGEFAEKDGLSFEQYENFVNGKPVTLKTGRANIDKARLQQWADEIGPHLKARKGASWKQVVNILDNWADMKDARPAEYDRAVREKEIDPEFMRQTLRTWRNDSVALGLAERLNRQDNEAGIKHEEVIEPTDRHHRRGQLVKATVNAFAEQAASGDTDAADHFSNGVSPEFRDEAVRDTLRLRKQGEGDEIGLRDALIRSFDEYEEVEEEPDG